MLGDAWTTRRSSGINLSLRKEFERVGGTRVQYSLYLFNGEPHECERVIRYMQRVAKGIPGDIRLFPMEESTWDAQVVITECLETTRPGTWPN